MLSAINKELFCVSVPSRYQILKHGGFWLNCGFPPSLIFFFHLYHLALLLFHPLILFSGPAPGHTIQAHLVCKIFLTLTLNLWVSDSSSPT